MNRFPSSTQDSIEWN